MRKLLLGYDAAGRPIRLGSDQAKAHESVTGASGSGKSKYLLQKMQQLLRLRQPFCLLDPHGSLFYDVLKYCAHYVLDREVVILNLSAPDQIIGFNPFRRAPEGDISVQVDRRVQATMHAWNVPDTDQTPTLARTLRLIYTVMLEHNLGLPQVAHLIDFHAKQIRAQLIENLSTELVQKEWQELQALRPKEWRDEILSAKNRLFRFLSSPTLSRFMGLPSLSVDLAEIMAKGKILLVNLAPSDYLSEEGGRAFGALLVNELFETALRRRVPFGGDPPPYFCILDEFQRFVSLDIANGLDQLRKFGCFFTLCHQRFGQLDANIVDAVLTNCRIKVVFGGLPTESARLMADELFIGKLDPKKIKAAIYQTKFWPRYARDKAYTSTSSHSSSSSRSHGTSSTNFSSAGQSAMYDGNNWFGFPQGATGTSESVSSGSSFGQSSGWAEADSFGQSDGVADIPIFIPVPFEELSSVQYYSLDEQRAELTAALKEQFPRHCFIKIHDQETQPMLVPVVEDLFTPARNLKWYVQRQMSREHALSPADTDDLLRQQELALLQSLPDQQLIEPPQPKLAPIPEVLTSPQAHNGPIWLPQLASTLVPLGEAPPVAKKPVQSAGNRRGPKTDLETHTKVLAVVDKYGDAWTEADNLFEICELLDRGNILIPKTWPMLRVDPVRSWCRALQLHPDLVRKAIKYHCQAAKKFSLTSAGS